MLRWTCKYQNSRELVEFRCRSQDDHTCECPSILHRGAMITRNSAASRNFAERTFLIPRFRCYSAHIPWSSSFSKFRSIKNFEPFVRVYNPSSASSVLSLSPCYIVDSTISSVLQIKWNFPRSTKFSSLC